MKQYRKKPVIIEAVQFTGNNTQEVVDWVDKKYLPCGDDNEILITTLEGMMRASIGDWVIKGVNGEYYPCKPDIFEKTYEAV